MGFLRIPEHFAVCPGRPEGGNLLYEWVFCVFQSISRCARGGRRGAIYFMNGFCAYSRAFRGVPGGGRRPVWAVHGTRTGSPWDLYGQSTGPVRAIHGTRGQSTGSVRAAHGTRMGNLLHDVVHVRFPDCCCCPRRTGRSQSISCVVFVVFHSMVVFPGAGRAEAIYFMNGNPYDSQYTLVFSTTGRA